MKTNKQKWIGVGIMLVALAFASFFFWFFKFDGVVINDKNTTQFLEFLFTVSFLPLGLYFGLYFYGGRKNANQVGGLFFLTLVVIILIGYFLHR